MPFNACFRISVSQMTDLSESGRAGKCEASSLTAVRHPRDSIFYLSLEAIQ